MVIFSGHFFLFVIFSMPPKMNKYKACYGPILPLLLCLLPPSASRPDPPCALLPALASYGTGPANGYHVVSVNPCGICWRVGGVAVLAAAVVLALLLPMGNETPQ